MIKQIIVLATSRLTVFIWYSLVFPALILCSCTKDPKPEVLGDDTFVKLALPIERTLIDHKLDSDGLLNGGAKYGDIKQVDSLILTSFDTSITLPRLEGLQYFTNLAYLRCRSIRNDIYDGSGTINPKYRSVLDTLDVSQNRKLTHLDCSGFSSGGGYSPSIRYLQLGNNTQLKRLIYSIHMQQTIDLSKLHSLEELDFYSGSPISSLSVCQNTSLVSCRSNAKVVYVASLSQVGSSWSSWAKYVQCQ